MVGKGDPGYRLPLICGDPWKTDGTAASFTRFVLPFSYVPEKLPERGASKGRKGDFFFEPDPQPIRDRDYFAGDTAHALFEQALWLKLKEGNEPEKRQHRTGFTRGASKLVEGVRSPVSVVHHDVGVCTPRLALFEWNEGRETGWSGVDPDPNRIVDDPMRIGMFFVDLYFSEGDEVQLRDLLELNERFRYYRRPFPEHQKFMDEMFKADPILEGSNHRIKANSQGTGSSSASSDPGAQNRNGEPYLQRWVDLLDKVAFVDGKKKKWRLFPRYASQPGSASWDFPQRFGNDNRHPAPFPAESRCWVWSCAVIHEGSRALTKLKGDGEERSLDIRDLRSWIAFVNVDAPDNREASDFEREWIRGRCYRRWEHDGTCYGFTSHSGVVITGAGDVPVWKHFGEHYFSIALLLYYVRGVLYRFSTRLYEISLEARQDGHENRRQDRFLKSFERLNWNFTLFTNLYRFPMLSNQQQAIEIYSKLRTAFDVDELFDEIQREIDTSHKFLQQNEVERQNKLVLTLTVVATVGLAFSLVTGFLGMNLFLVEGETFPVGTTVTGWPLFFTVLAIFWLLLLIAIVQAQAIRRGIGWLRSRRMTVTVMAAVAIGAILGWLYWPT